MKKGGRPVGALPRGKVLVGGDEAGPRNTRLDRPPPLRLKIHHFICVREPGDGSDPPQ